MFGPKVLEVVNSPLNGKLEVRQLGRDIYVTTSGLTQSGGLIKELWSKTLKRLKTQDTRHKGWLILGLATGTLAKTISDKYSPTRIVGVEVDPIMLDIGRKYFALDRIPSLQIVQQDAQGFVQRTTSKFDIVVVDLFVGDQLPDFVYQKKFLEHLGRLGRLVIVNHLFYDADKKALAQRLSNKLAQIYPHTHLMRELTNLLIICA